MRSERRENTNGLEGFLSYALVDRPIARSVVDALSERNLNIWFDERDLDDSRDLDVQIWPALLRSHYTIVLITQNSVEKGGYFRQERAIADEIRQSTAKGSLRWGGNWRPANESVVTGFRLMVYLIWDEADLPDEERRGHHTIVRRSDTLAATCRKVEEAVRSGAPTHQHEDIVSDYATALSHQALRMMIEQQETAEPFRRAFSEKIHWPEHMARQYEQLLASKKGMFESAGDDTFWRERKSFCTAEHERFRNLVDRMSSDLRIRTLNQHINDHSVCLELMNRYAYPKPDPKSRCHVCKSAGVILHGIIDAGGKSLSDYSENFFVVCESCGYAWYDYEVDMSGNEWKVFDYKTNIYVDH